MRLPLRLANSGRHLVRAGVVIGLLLASGCAPSDPGVMFHLVNPCAVALAFDSWWLPTESDQVEPDTSKAPFTEVVPPNAERTAAVSGLLLGVIVVWEIQEIGFRERYWIPYEGYFHAYPHIEVGPDPSVCPSA